MFDKVLIFLVLNSFVFITNSARYYRQKFVRPVQNKLSCQQIIEQLQLSKLQISQLNRLIDMQYQRGHYIGNDQSAVDFAYGFSHTPYLEDVMHRSAIIRQLSEWQVSKLRNFDTDGYLDLNVSLAQLTQCIGPYIDEFCVPNKEIFCDIHDIKYPPLDGFCSNPKKPKQGSSESTFSSLIHPFYEDGVQSIRGSINKYRNLPSASQLSKLFDTCSPSTRIESNFNVGALFFGQIIAHDVSFRINHQRPDGGFGVSCCTADGRSALRPNDTHPQCLPIIKANSGQCINFMRTQTIINNDCLLSPIRQFNKVTAAPDLSIIYDNSKEACDKLRLHKNGLMKLDASDIFSYDEKGKRLLGDFRSEQTPQLAAWTVILTRFHNWIAIKLKESRPDWNDELLFQEARRWCIAIYQHIVYNEWLPIFIGKNRNRFSNSKCNDISTKNEFAHGVFRYLHLRSPEIIELYDKYGRISFSTLLSDIILKSHHLYERFDDVIRGLYYQYVKNDGCHNEIMNKLFKGANGVAVDLLAFDYQRGRDHGLGLYYLYVQRCHGIRLERFSDLKKLMSRENIMKLKSVYSDVKDIDLLVGVEMENTVNGLFSPTNACIINEQFECYKENVFFYKNPSNPHPFRKDQLAEIQKVTIAQILCITSGIGEVTKHAFVPISKYNPIRKCHDVLKFKIIP